MKNTRAPAHGQPRRLSKLDLAKLVAEATADAYGEPEQAVAWFTRIEKRLALPFETRVLGVDVTVEKLDLTERGEIIALCRRGRERQAIPISYLPLPESPPQGWEWVEAYRYWAGEWR